MHLIQSDPDDISELSGLELVEKKYSSGPVWAGNILKARKSIFTDPDPESIAHHRKARWPGKRVICFQDWKSGMTSITGGEYLEKSLSPDSPRLRRLIKNSIIFQATKLGPKSILLSLISPNSYWEPKP